MNKKYEILEKEGHVDLGKYRRQPATVTVRRIRALVDIPRHNVKAGDVGGWVQSEENLSQEGDAWIAKNAAAVYSSVVKENALLQDECVVLSGSVISGEAVVEGVAYVEGSGVGGKSRVGGYSTVMFSQVDGEAVLKNFATLSDGSVVKDNAVVSGETKIINSRLCDSVKVGGEEVSVANSSVSGDTEINGSVVVLRSTVESCRVNGKVQIVDSAVGPDVSVSNNASIINGSVVSGFCKVSENVNINNSKLVYPPRPRRKKKGVEPAVLVPGAYYKDVENSEDEGAPTTARVQIKSVLAGVQIDVYPDYVSYSVGDYKDSTHWFTYKEREELLSLLRKHRERSQSPIFVREMDIVESFVNSMWVMECDE